jgi:CheY-like chemotaxis protein
MPRIVVIDDLPSALQAIAMPCASAGYETRTCRNGKSVLAALRREAFDPIITDIYMPATDGLEAIDVAKLMGDGRRLEKRPSQTGLPAPVGVAMSERPVPRRRSSLKTPRRPDKGLRE